MDQIDPYHDQGRPGPPDRPRRPRLPEPLGHRPLVPGKLACPVIVGYGGSASSRNALAYAAGLARRLRRPLMVVYVVSSRVYFDPIGGSVFVVPCDPSALRQWLITELEQAAGLGDLAVEVCVRRGRTAMELAAAAAELKADGVVVGASRGWRHRITGSVPAWLTRHACCPVITVP